MSGNLSISSRTTVALRVFLLVILLRESCLESCPRPCECKRDVYLCGNGTLKLRWDTNEAKFSSLFLTCLVPNVTCSDLPQLNLQVFSIFSYYCSPNILKCMSHVLQDSTIERVYLYDMTEPLAIDHIADLNYVKLLYLSLTDADTSIPVDTINSWDSLNVILLQGGRLNLPPNSFNHRTLRGLYLSDNNIDNLPADCFNGLPGLEVLDIKYNKIENISVGAFRGLNKLGKLSIEHVGLKTIEVGTFSDTRKLKKLSLTDAPIKTLSSGLLEGLELLEEVSIYGQLHHTHKEAKVTLDSNTFAQLPSLDVVQLTALNINSLSEKIFYGSNNITKISIRASNIRTFPLKIFTNLSHLINLDLSDNSIEVLLDGTFDNLTSLKHLNLGYNKLQQLPNGIFSALTSLVDLNLRSNNLSELSELTFANLPSLLTLTLAGNKILTLPNGIFNNLKTLITLDLSNNLMEKLTVYQVFGLTNLTTLLLRNNKFSYISTMYIDELQPAVRDEDSVIGPLIVKTIPYLFVPITPFTILTRLEKVDLSGNKIRRLFSGWQFGMQHIKQLNLSRNCFTHLQYFDVDFSKLNITIDLRHNYIAELVLDSRLSFSNDSLAASSSLILNAPITCDCNSFGLYLRANGARLPHEPRYSLNESTCIAPPHLKGHLFKDVTAMDLNCNFSKHCPSTCSSCVARSATNEVIIVCPTLPHTLPDLRSDAFPYHYFHEPTITLKLYHQPQDISNVSIHTLNLTNAGIHEITFHPSDSLRILDVSRNNLATIPDVFFERNITLYISNNPLSCDCALIKKLNNYRVADLDHVVCANEGKFNDIDFRELCNRNIALMGYICTGIMCGIFFLKIAFAVYKYVKKNWIHIKNGLLGRPPEYTITIEKRLDAAKKFDLFISFAHEDTAFVRDTLLPKLEKDYNQNVCVHSRDWVVGDLIADQIIKSVENSRRTIIILTEHFILSEWSYLEFRTAHNLSIQEGRPRVIMILLKEDIASDERLSKEIKSYIAINTYLLWGDPNFWKKLKQILPRKGQKLN